VSKITKIGVVGPRPYFVGGHDPDNDTRKYIRESISTILEKLLNNKRIVIGLTGLNIGAEQDFAIACKKMDVDYHCYLPYEEQELRWKYLPNTAIELYLSLLKTASYIEIVSEGKYSPKKNLTKLQKIIQESDELIYIRSPKIRLMDEYVYQLLDGKVIHEVHT
jgi:uncharacterized phage-like protein YoqJ